LYLVKRVSRSIFPYAALLDAQSHPGTGPTTRRHRDYIGTCRCRAVRRFTKRSICRSQGRCLCRSPAAHRAGRSAGGYTGNSLARCGAYDCHAPSRNERLYSRVRTRKRLEKAAMMATCAQLGELAAGNDTKSLPAATLSPPRASFRKTTRGARLLRSVDQPQAAAGGPGSSRLISSTLRSLRFGLKPSDAARRSMGRLSLSTLIHRRRMPRRQQ
jgi:hypothetical protein